MTKHDILGISRGSGVEIAVVDGVVTWTGSATGAKKPRGPLSGRKIALLVAAEFSDFQAYHLVEYLSEFGAEVEFVAADGPKWKNTRPTHAAKGVHGMWGLSIDPIPVLGYARSTYRALGDAVDESYDGIIVLGGHSADILTTEKPALNLLERHAESGATIGAIGEAGLALVAAHVVGGRRCTGNAVVSYLLERVGSYIDEPVVRDGRLVTARDTVDTAAFVREFARAYDASFTDPRENSLAGRQIGIIGGEDFEDIELVAPTLELLYRGADLTILTFPAPLRSRPPLLGLDVVMGNFGVSIPFQEIPDDRYRIAELSRTDPASVEIVMIPGAFCPWNMVAAGSPIEWLKRAASAGTNIAAICHGAIPLSAADLVKGRRIAGVGACGEHVSIMGGTFEPDCSAIVDGPFVTGRVPKDVPEFIDAITYALLPE